MDCCIRLFCHRLTRKQRKIVTTTAFLLFLTACLHAILASLSGLGEPRGKMKIEYVRPLDCKHSINSPFHSKNVILLL